MQIEDRWTIVEPGLIQLATTKFRIRCDKDHHFRIEYDGASRGIYGTLESAKHWCLELVKDLLLMGIKP